MIGSPVIVSPHPDDAELGASVYLEGAHILLVTSTDRRREEQLAANKISRADSFSWLGGMDGYVHPNVELVRSIEELRTEPVPVIIGPPADDDHQDHRAVALAIRSAFRRSATTILEYETPSVRPGWTPNFYVPISERELRDQAAALRCFTSQSGPYLDCGWLRSRAVGHGLRAGVPMAQAFRIERATQTIGQLWELAP